MVNKLSFTKIEVRLVAAQNTFQTGSSKTFHEIPHCLAIQIQFDLQNKPRLASAETKQKRELMESKQSFA